MYFMLDGTTRAELTEQLTRLNNEIRDAEEASFGRVEELNFVSSASSFLPDKARLLTVYGLAGRRKSHEGNFLQYRQSGRIQARKEAGFPILRASLCPDVSLWPRRYAKKKLFLFDDSAMNEKEYLSTRAELTEQLTRLNIKRNV